MGTFAKGELNGKIQKGNLEMGEKAEVLMRILYKKGEGTVDEIYNEIPLDVIQRFNWDKPKVRMLLWQKEPFYLVRKFPHNSYLRNGNGRHQIYIIKQRVVDWFQRQDAGDITTLKSVNSNTEL